MINLDLVNIGLLAALVILIGMAVLVAFQWLQERRDGSVSDD